MILTIDVNEECPVCGCRRMYAALQENHRPGRHPVPQYLVAKGCYACSFRREYFE